MALLLDIPREETTNAGEETTTFDPAAFFGQETNMTVQGRAPPLQPDWVLM
jgi:hypothetical protein